MDNPTRYCCECGDPIYKSIGFTLAGDIAKFLNGEITGEKVRQACPKCGTRWANMGEAEREVLFKRLHEAY